MDIPENSYISEFNSLDRKSAGKKDKEKNEEKNKKNKDEEGEKKEKPTSHAVAMETVVRWVAEINFHLRRKKQL